MKKMYATRDSVSCSWQDPQSFMNDQEAERSFCYALAASNLPDSFVKDVDLYCVGSFNELTGELTYSEPVHVANGRCHMYQRFRAMINGNSNFESEVISDEIPKKEN